MSTAPIFSSQTSIWRLGMVDWRFNFGVYAAIVVGQFLINSTVGAIMYATSDDLSGHVDQSALNAAFMTGIYIFVAAIITTTTHLRAVSQWGIAPNPGTLDLRAQRCRYRDRQRDLVGARPDPDAHLLPGEPRVSPRSGLVAHRRDRLDRLRRGWAPDWCGLAPRTKPVDGRPRHYCGGHPGSGRHRSSGHLVGPHPRPQVRLPAPDALGLLVPRPRHSRSRSRRVALDPHGSLASLGLNGKANTARVGSNSGCSPHSLSTTSRGRGLERKTRVRP